MKKILALLMALIILVVALPITVGAAAEDIKFGEVDICDLVLVRNKIKER